MSQENQESKSSARERMESLFQEIEAVDPEMLAPHFEKDAGDQTLGYLSDEFAQKAYCLSAFYRREAKRLQVDLEAMGVNPLEDEEFARLKQKYETLIEIFWYLLRGTANHWPGGIGIRKNWEIIKPSPNSESEMDQLIDKILKRLTR